MNCYDIASFLDQELKIKDIEDDSNNGLQVANQGRISKVGLAVSATKDVFELAKKAGCQMMVVHHGISWKDSLKYITDINYDRIRFLINNNLALYGCHLPLDKHSKLGNNIQLCKLFGLKNVKEFGEYNKSLIGFMGDLKKEVLLRDFIKIIEDKLNTTCDVLDFGKSKVKSVAIISGGGASMVAQAAKHKADVYLTGEPKLSAYAIAKELSINLVYAGHYATETLGVKALAKLLKKRFGVKTVFLDTPIKY
jgi:dinuclear metal center YbgI/SA1388 family protein